MSTSVKFDLALTLASIEKHDLDYEARYGLVLDALSLANQCGYAAGFDFDQKEPGFPIVAYIELPTGQVSWHMPLHPWDWDRHTTEAKYGRCRAYADFVTTRPPLALTPAAKRAVEPSPQAAVDAFNDAHPLGTVVRYWRGAREGEPSGTGPTRSEAELLGGHTPVVWIEGCSGCIALSHVEVVGG